MKIYVTSDTHFNHKKLIEWGRPENFEELELKSHALIPEDAYLIHLGDFCIGKDEEMHNLWFSAVGHIQHRLLVKGNHDNKSRGWYLEHGWHAIADQVILTVFGKRVIFSHRPVDPKLYPDTVYNVHGHTHGNTHRDFEVKGFYDRAYHREIAPEIQNYAPRLLDQRFLEREALRQERMSDEEH